MESLDIYYKKVEFITVCNDLLHKNTSSVLFSCNTKIGSMVYKSLKKDNRLIIEVHYNDTFVNNFRLAKPKLILEYPALINLIYV